MREGHIKAQWDTNLVSVRLQGIHYAKEKQFEGSDRTAQLSTVKVMLAPD